MNCSHYVDANHVTQSCNLTHLIYGGPPPQHPCTPSQHRDHYPPTIHHPLHKLSFTINNLSMSQYEACRAATCIMRCLGDLSHTETMQEAERERKKLFTVGAVDVWGRDDIVKVTDNDVWVYVWAYTVYTSLHIQNTFILVISKNLIPILLFSSGDEINCTQFASVCLGTNRKCQVCMPFICSIKCYKNFLNLSYSLEYSILEKIQQFNILNHFVQTADNKKTRLDGRLSAPFGMPPLIKHHKEKANVLFFVCFFLIPMHDLKYVHHLQLGAPPLWHLGQKCVRVFSKMKQIALYLLTFSYICLFSSVNTQCALELVCN